MEEKQEIQKVKRYKDGDTRDRLGRWAGKVVTVRKEYYELIEAWQKQTGMKRAQFWREALMIGVVEVAKKYGIQASFPVLTDTPSEGVQVKVKKRFPAWLFRKRTSNGLRYPQVGGRGFYSRAEKTRSEENAEKSRRIPLVGCTLC